jgi:hypothetical protein
MKKRRPIARNEAGAQEEYRLTKTQACGEGLSVCICPDADSCAVQRCVSSHWRLIFRLFGSCPAFSLASVTAQLWRDPRRSHVTSVY